MTETPGAAPVIKEASENTVRASQIGRTINVAVTLGAAPLVKKAAGNVVEASHILRAAKLMETLEAAQISVQEITNWSN